MTTPHIASEKDRSGKTTTDEGEKTFDDAVTGSLANPKAPSLPEGEVRENEDKIIITGADASEHLIPLRDDFDPSLTFRSMLLSSMLACFQAIMTQVYQFKPTEVSINGTFIVLIAYFLGNAWAAVLPRGDKLEARWRAKGNTGTLPIGIKIASFFNYGPWGLKEHTICAVTATSASQAKEGIQVFAAQKVFYDMQLGAATVILATISIGLFGYGLCGIFREIAVYHVDAVYWTTLPTVKTLQGLHWDSVKDSKPLRWFWYSFTGMFLYQFVPAYIWPQLNSISIPCLAAEETTGETANLLGNLFGGSANNQGLGLFSISLDWQYLTSLTTSMPLVLQAHQAIGIGICMIVMLAIYYGNVWNAKAQPFMATRLQKASGGPYPTKEVFVNGVLDKAAFEKHGAPDLAGTFAFAMFMANAAIGALVTHCFVFWGRDLWKTFTDARKGIHADRHHRHMVEHYKETPWWWFVIVLVVSFVLGLVVVLTSDISLPPWAYIVSLLLGSFIAPLSTVLYARFGNGIATNNLSKMLAGLMLPGRPVGNMYFAAWSHSVIMQTVNLSNDLKIGEYLKIPPRVMFLTQLWGTVLGGFVSYATMTAIVTGREKMLAESNGSNAWSGALLQGYNTNASAWALAEYLYMAGTKYWIVPVGIAFGALLVLLHRLFVKYVPKIGKFDTNDINMPQLIQYSGFIPYNQSQTCILLSSILAGLYVQFYLRNYKPRIFKDFSYLVTAAFDGGSLLCLFILSFAVFGAGGKEIDFPQWWGHNTEKGNLDHCPSSGS
ncbi:OPT oligopeptide transporter [Rhypophila sp. PSN 637]